MGSVAVAVDGTVASRDALATALAFARRRGDPLSGVFVLDSGWTDFIGNDWQSSRNARQGFLDYVLEQHRRQAELARRQFEEAAGNFPAAHFRVLVGEPTQALAALMERGEADLLVLGREVFRECARPSVKRLARTLTRKLGEAVFLV